MHRAICVLLLWAAAAGAAPQDSNITFVKIQPPDTARQQRLQHLPPPLPENEFIRITRQEDVTAQFEDSETTTDTAEPLAETTTPPAPRTTSARSFTKPSPRFISKLSYFNKANDFSTNIVEKPEKKNKRKYKSRCRCEKIWNCPKLQITVPRCPDEYFLCCF